MQKRAPRRPGAFQPPAPVAEQADPRKVQREQFALVFAAAAAAAGAVAAEHAASVAADALAAEASCYKAAIRASRESADPPLRSWDSGPFVDIYSTRCGAVFSALDPESSSCREYGPVLYKQILSKAVSIADIGRLSEREMCPPATERERAEIATRSAQHVVEKESTLFKCPHCHARRCTYYEKQVRSLDEPPDYFCICLACHRRFKGHH